MSSTAPSRARVTVGALALDDRGRGLFLRSHKWRGLWGTPGGHIEYGESLLTAVKRETFEETGLTLMDLRWAPRSEAVEHPQLERPAHYVQMNFTARVAGGDVRLNFESDAFAWRTPARALRELPLNWPTRMLVLHFLNHGHSGRHLRDGAGR